MKRRALVTGALGTTASILWSDPRIPFGGRTVLVGEWRLFLERRTGIARYQKPPYCRVEVYSSGSGSGRFGGSDSPWGHYEVSEGLLSVVGPVVSVMHESMSGSEGRSDHSRRICARSLDRHLNRLLKGEERMIPSHFDGGDWASLADLFDDGAALKAVVAAAPVKAALRNRAPRTWEEFYEYLAPPLPEEHQGDWMSLGSSYAIMNVAGTTARVRFSLDAACRACDVRPEFEAEVPIPAYTQRWFDDAKRNHTLGRDLAV